MVLFPVSPAIAVRIRTLARMAPSSRLLTLNDGNKVPWLAYGTGTALYNQDATNAVALAIKCGFTHLDGAQMYKNEASLGAAVAASGIPRSEFYITTKLERLADGETATDSLRASLARLAMEYVDLYLIHVPTYHQQHPGRLKEVWVQMVAAKRAGLAKSIGVSNFNVAQLQEILETNTEPPAVNQIEYHPFVLAKMQPLLDLHRKYGIVTASYGGLTPILPGRTAVAELAPARAALTAALDAARERRGTGVSQNQILLKWLQQKGVLAVTTSSKESRIKEYLATSDLPDLSDEEIQALESAVSGVHFRAFGTFGHMDE